MARNLLPIELHQLLVWKFPHAKSVTEACAAAAREYGLSSETMRTYAYNGIGYRSKAYVAIAADVEDMKRYEESGWRLVSESERRLAESLDLQARSLRQVSEQFAEMRNALQKRISERENA